MKTFEPLAHGRDNHFNLLRILAASAVIVSHAFPIALGRGAAEPLTGFMPFSLGSASVKIFFAISGFLVLKSWDRHPKLLDFTVARVLRIFPALAVVALVTAFVAGPIFTTLPPGAYFANRATLEYAPRAISLYFLSFELPGVFTATPYGDAVNGPLWTLYYETLCYAGIAAAGIVGLLTRRRFPLLLLLYAAGYVAIRAHLIPGGFTLYAVLSFPFLIGMAVYEYRRLVPAYAGILAALALLAAAALAFHILAEEACTLAIAYGALWAGQAKAPLLLHYNRIGDYSYGVYIYGWPVEQILVTLLPGIAPAALFCLAIPAAVLCGCVSWYVVEKPSLAAKRRLAERLALLPAKSEQGSLARPQDEPAT